MVLGGLATFTSYKKKIANPPIKSATALTVCGVAHNRLFQFYFKNARVVFFSNLLNFKADFVAEITDCCPCPDEVFFVVITEFARQLCVIFFQHFARFLEVSFAAKPSRAFISHLFKNTLINAPVSLRTFMTFCSPYSGC